MTDLADYITEIDLRLERLESKPRRIVSVNPLPSDIDWAQVETLLGVKIEERRTLPDYVANAADPYRLSDYLRDHPEVLAAWSGFVADRDDLGQRGDRAVDSDQGLTQDERVGVLRVDRPQSLVDGLAALDQLRELILKLSDALSVAAHGDSSSSACETSEATAGPGTDSQGSPYGGCRPGCCGNDEAGR